MKLTSIIKLGSAFVSLGKGAKNLIFVDGKFDIQRALILLIALMLILLGVHFLGTEQMTIAIELLDSVSDQIGTVGD